MTRLFRQPGYDGQRAKWAPFLKERTVKDGRRAYAHGRLRKARRGLNKLVEEGRRSPSPRCSGSTTAAAPRQQRRREYRRQAQGHAPPPPGIAAASPRQGGLLVVPHARRELLAVEVLRAMPTGDDVGGLFAAASSGSKREGGAPDGYGTGIVWEEFHMPANYRQ